MSVKYLSILPFLMPTAVYSDVDWDELIKLLELRQSCMQVIHQKIDSSGMQVDDTSIEHFVSSVFESFPYEIKSIFKEASRNVKTKHDEHNIENSNDYIEDVVTANELIFSTFCLFGIEGCGTISLEIIPYNIYAKYILDKTLLKEKFAKIEIYESIDIQSSILIMLTMEASHNEWSSEWLRGFSKYKGDRTGTP